ncbi:hypothetical protein GJ654_12355 [Rhodoblastus acidophilus]|jgi:hypothetical protein|uniref:Uncharacterized protein n=1 Tax=Rhodoblastus acidophilus TaxID=1074 RepID=A0A6N8DMG7_RHOAC|nr:hypothetical protein [Rhodoblastus acidophilus]MCW2275326.1 hypothetical protein [Rhodoblastus acidophilus]MTV31782.1 hypothetical protein [Rhodoblastus acidophilus]
MACYQFFLRKPDGSINFKSAQICSDLSAAWGVIGDMARDAGEQASGSIFVKNDQGEVVILVGVASARVLTGQKPAPRSRRWTA